MSLRKSDIVWVGGHNRFLTMNMYVRFTKKSNSSILAKSLTEGMTPEEAVAAISDHITSSILYDHLKARTVEAGYLPFADRTLCEGKGICFDIASLFACMLRSIAIPCKLVIGHADMEYHAWNEVLINDKWLRYDLTSKITGKKFIVYFDERVL